MSMIYRPTDECRAQMREETAYHEAGHAVATYVLGQPFEYVTIVPDAAGGSFGHVEGIGAAYLDETTLKRQREVARIEAVTLVAGPLADARWVEAEPAFWRSSDVSYEYECAEANLRDVYTSERRVQEVMGEAVTHAQQIVAEQWPAIEALAAALMARETLDYRDAVRIIRAAQSEEEE